MKRSASGSSFERCFVGDAAPQPGRDRLLLDLLQAGGHAGFAEIFLRQHVGGDLRPLLRNFDVLGVEHDRTVRIADLARGQTEHDVRVGRLSLFGVAPLDPHFLPLKSWCFGIGGLHAQYRTPTISPRRSGSISAAPTSPLFLSATQPVRLSQPGLVLARTPRTPRGSPSGAKIHARATAARSTPANPFWRARRTSLPARRTCRRLGQAGARTSSFSMNF